MTKAIVQVSPNPDTIPGGGDVYDPRTFTSYAQAINATRALALQSQTQIEALQAQSATGLAPIGVNPVEATSSVGTGPQFAYDDHAHAGVSEVIAPTSGGTAVLTGELTLLGSVYNPATTGTLTFAGFGVPRLVSVTGLILATDTFILTTGAITLTLPAAASVPAWWPVYVRNNDTGNAASVAAHAGDTIDGAGSRTLDSPGSSSAFVGAWFVSDAVSRWSAHFTGG